MCFQPQYLRIQMIRLLNGGHYHIHILRPEPADAGHGGTARERVYLVLAHKRRTTLLHSPAELYTRVSAAVREQGSTRPSDYFVATHSEIVMHGQQWARTRKRKWKGAPWIAFFGLQMQCATYCAPVLLLQWLFVLKPRLQKTCVLICGTC